LWKDRSAKRFLYKTKESLQDAWDLLKKDLILLAGSDYDWVKEDGKIAVGAVLKTIRPPNSSDVCEEEGADSAGVLEDSGVGAADGNHDSRTPSSGEPGEVILWELHPLNNEVDWNQVLDDIPQDATYADWYPVHGVAIFFFFNLKLRASFLECWTAIHNGWKAAFRKKMTAEQLKVPPSEGCTQYLPEQIEWCLKNIEIPAPPPPGGVSFMEMDPFKQTTLDFSNVPLPPSDLAFGNYRNGFAFAILFFFSTMLRRKYLPRFLERHSQRLARGLQCPYFSTSTDPCSRDR
jgi:hypothetical protein